MGFAEIQAAFAANAPAPSPAPAVAAAPLAPSPFSFTPAPAPAPVPAQPAAPTQQAFTFTPPSSVGPAPQSFAPINPPGERAVLAAPPAAPPAPAEPTPKAKRTRKPKAEPAKVDLGTESDNGHHTPDAIYDAMSDAGPPACTAAVELKDLPADGSTVEDIVEELFARGVVRVHLEFTKDGLK